ncbi:MAG TPA: ring-opening amidohydrolase [Chloroflexota bacterium]|nr:ring-opening amidohydrolase [Chloroflexota bacterium]
MHVGVYKIPMNDPADASALRGLIEAGTVDPRLIVASIGKTEGNGGANDFTRALATLSFSRLIGGYLDLSPEAVQERVALVWSGGCEGVISPHATFFTRDDHAIGTPTTGGGLALSVQRTRAFLPEEVGRMPEVLEVASATRRALDDLGIVDPRDVHYVQVKGPLLTPARIRDAEKRGATVVTTDPNRSKAYARGATALGVALALGEVQPEQINEATIANDLNLFTSVASTSAGGELVSCEVIVFTNSPRSSSPFRIGHALLRDAVDAPGVRSALQSAGLSFDHIPSDEQRSRVTAVFAKAEAPPGGQLRGWRTTMLSDADINYERHARAAVGAVIASVTGDPAIFVSGGTEHQGPPGHAPIAAIVATK